ncbi:MAG: hypothetical protein RLP44_22805 [Aggregatilineales bacterium]
MFIVILQVFRLVKIVFSSLNRFRQQISTTDTSTQAALPMRIFRHSTFAALIVSLIFLVSMIALVRDSQALNDGKLIYGLDDAYIHMSIARNFVEHGVWGITQYDFSSTTSSPLWTGLLALIYAFTGVHENLPLILNLIFGIGAIFAANRLLMRFETPALYRLVLLLALIILTPFNTLVLIGMEHVLQILMAILLVDEFFRIMGADEKAFRVSDGVRLGVLSALTAMTRYEDLLLIGVLCLLFLLKGRWRLMLITGISASVPIIIYGMIAMSNGWDFLPTSLTIKSGAMSYLRNATWQGRYQFLVVDTYKIFANQHILSLMLLSAMGAFLYIYEKSRDLWDKRLILLVIYALTTLMSVRFVSWPDPGTFSRYEAYLVALSLIFIPAALGFALPHRLTRKLIPALVVGLILLAFVLNDIYQRYDDISFRQPVVTATTEIYRQQVQMGRFLAEHYNDSNIATNDIGAVTFFTDIHNVDIWGLGTIEVARAKNDNIYSTARLAEIVAENDTQIAVIYSVWMDGYGGLPDDWILVEQWVMENPPVILGYHTVSFYALNAEAVPDLRANLDLFAPSLPDGVRREVAS